MTQTGTLEMPVIRKRVRGRSLDSLLKPRSVAVIGASTDPQKLGYVIVDNLVARRFPGKVYPINREARSILGLEVFPSVLDVPGSIDLAVVVVPAVIVPKVLEECGKKGVSAAIIISAGFREISEEGRQAEQQLTEIAHQYGIRLLGPNCLGVINTYHNFSASFAESMPQPGSVSVLTQSGAIAVAILDWAIGTDVGFASFVSLGNKADIEESDLLDYWRRDPACRVVVGYLEDFSNGRRFLKAARDLTSRKPLILLKVGTTVAGAAAMRSHTGAVATPDRVVDAAFRQAGVIRARTLDELFDYTMAFAHAPLPLGKNVAVITNAGGPGVLTADAIDRMGLALAPLSVLTRDTLTAQLPPYAAVQNPVDLLGDASSERYGVALRATVADPGVHSAIVLLTAQAVTETERIARVIAHVSKVSNKTILASFMGGVAVQRGRDILENARVPVYAYPERAVRALAALTSYARWRGLVDEDEVSRESGR